MRPYYDHKGITIYHGDCLEILPSVGPVDLIIADLPYFRVKGDWWDNQWDTESGFLSWVGGVFVGCKSAMAQSGCLYVFTSPKLAWGVESALRQRFQVLSSITWKKPPDPGFDGWRNKCSKKTLRAWYPASERILFAENPENPCAPILKGARLATGLSSAEIAARGGFFGKTNHGGLVSNWETGKTLPTEAQYNILVERCGYALPPYSALPIRHFCVTPDVQYDDVWEFPRVRPYKGKHPCEKPITLLSHMIAASTAGVSTVLDPCMGTGSTLLSAKELARKAIGIEIEEKYCEMAAKRLAQEGLW